MTYFLISFLAGVLTVLAPCVFSLLPVIIGSSVGSKDKYKPAIIIVSLAISLFIFTLLLKATTLFIDIDPRFLNYFSGAIIIFFGLISVFPNVWDALSLKLNLSSNSDKLLEKSRKRQDIFGTILTGAALGPVFSSCSPTYAIIVATVLRANILEGLVYIFAYILGLSLILLLVAVLGQRFTKKLRWATNPNGIFKKVIGVIFIIVGLSILFGLDKKIIASLPENSLLSSSSLENQLAGNFKKNSTQNLDSSQILNVKEPKKAPEITGIKTWINSDGESLEKLKGKVVLVDFWTYSCINCQRTLPYLTKWYDTYKDDGFVILGMHAPEFSFEQKKENVQKAVNDSKIKYPVGLDNDFATWNAYENQSWPAKYLIDKEGNLRMIHFGEGKYEETEQAIRLLLEEKGTKLNTETVSNKVDNTGNVSSMQTPETYLGFSRSEKFTNRAELLDNNAYNKPFVYSGSAGKALESDFWTLEGNWTISNENITSADNNAKFKMKYNAKEVYIVMSTDNPSEIKFVGNNKGEDVNEQGVIKVSESKLYRIVKASELVKDGEFELVVPKGVSLNALTFGS